MAQHTEDPVAYILSTAKARHVYEYVVANGPTPYETTRKELGLDHTEFHRLTRRLAQLNMLFLRAPKGEEFENRRIRVVLESTPRGHRLRPFFEEVKKVAEKQSAALPTSSQELLLA